LESAKAEPVQSGDSKPKESKPANESFSEHYSIISDKPTGTVKRSVDVRLKKKVSEEMLEGIAKEIRASNPRKFARTFIVYYLPEQTVGAGGWATSHFNPALEVNVLGLPADSEAEKANVAKAGEAEIGRWEYSAPPGYMVVALKTEKGVTVRRIFNDGSSLVEEMTPSLKTDEIILMPVEVNEAGDHWILDSDGNLRLMDNEGLIGKAVASGKKMNAEELQEAFGFSEEPKEKVATIFDPRTWTSADGQRTFFGTFTKLGDGELTVEIDGEPITFAIAKLSPADREFLGQGVSITTLDGTAHENGSVVRITADSILFKKDSGLVQIAMENLPEKMRQRFGYDQRIAAEIKMAEERQLAADKESETKLTNLKHKPKSPSSTQWYKGGSLHKATIAEWKNATQQNRLATAADWLSATTWKGHLNSPADFEKLKEKSQLLVDALAEAGSGNDLDSLKASEFAASLFLITNDFDP